VWVRERRVGRKRTRATASSTAKISVTDVHTNVYTKMLIRCGDAFR
jgi:hypothetical protein